MFKKIVIAALFAPFLLLASENPVGPVGPAKKFAWYSYLNPMNYALKGSRGPSDHPGDYYGGYTATKIAESAHDGRVIVDTVMNNPEGLKNASHGASYGTTYGALAGAGNAIEDGIHKHPYIAGTAVTLGAAAVVYHMLPGQEDYARWARLKAEEEQHKVALEQHKVVMEETKKQQQTLATATELRTCLNTHGRCRKKGQRVPSPCNSPTRRAALYDLALTDSIVNGYNKYA